MRGVVVHASADQTSLASALAPDTVGIEPWHAESEWVTQALRDTLGPAAGIALHLVAIDRQGGAHPLTDPDAEGPFSPPLLEAIESPALWAAVAPRRWFTCEKLHALHSAWPFDGRLQARFYKDGQKALAVLLSEPRAGAESDLRGEAERDRFLELIVRHWSIAREAAALGAFARSLMAAGRAGVIGIDRSGRVTYLSPIGEGILGVSASEASGADCARIFRPAVEEPHPLLEGLAGRLAQLELYVTDRHDRDVPVSLSMERITDAEGSVDGLVCVFRDLTEERAIDQEARRRERLAVIGELAAGAAHEIRNPLTGIGNAAQVLQMRLTDDESNRKMVDLIVQETQRLDRIITSLLGFARPGQPRMRETRIDEVVVRTLALQQPLYEKSGVRCERRIAGMIPPIYADPEQIQQVLTNLMRNAVQAMPDGGLLTVEVSVVRRRLHVRRKLGRRVTDRLSVPSKGPLKRFVRIMIRDTGCGIAPEVQARIFDPFYTTRSRGTGLGLSVSQSILQEHGGFISVQSVQGKGTTFEVDLPVERREGERREQG